MKEAAKEKTALQWHPAFYAGIQIEFAEEAHQLLFENEHQLGTKPKEIDVLIIKKDPKAAIRKNIGRIFRKYNIIEYKSPDDYLSIDDFYLVYGYTCFYKSDAKQVDEIKAGELTISFVTKRYPGKVIRHLQQEQNLKVKRQEKGIYYVYGDYFPIQFIVTSQLTEEENFWLHHLTNDLKKTEEANRIIQKYEKHRDEKLHQSMMDIIVKANEELFKEAGSMCEALLEICEELYGDRIKKQCEVKVMEQIREQCEVKVMEQIREEVKEEVKEQTMIALVRDGLIDLAEAAKRLSISEGEFRKRLV